MTSGKDITTLQLLCVVNLVAIISFLNILLIALKGMLFLAIWVPRGFILLLSETVLFSLIDTSTILQLKCSFSLHSRLLLGRPSVQRWGGMDIQPLFKVSMQKRSH